MKILIIDAEYWVSREIAERLKIIYEIPHEVSQFDFRRDSMKEGVELIKQADIILADFGDNQSEAVPIKNQQFWESIMGKKVIGIHPWRKNNFSKNDWHEKKRINTPMSDNGEGYYDIWFLKKLIIELVKENK